MDMTPLQPYLISAYYQWIVDNGCTPYIAVNADVEGAVVPREFVKDGHIVFNISPTAVRFFQVKDDFISFNARFGGKPMDVFIPFWAVEAIYPFENSMFGKSFPHTGKPQSSTTAPSPAEPKPPKEGSGEKKKPTLKVIK